MSCCPDCGPNRLPGCSTGCGSSRGLRCLHHSSTHCSTRRSDHCGPSRSTGCSPHCSPRCPDRCCPGCSENSFLSCRPRRHVHCLLGCRAGHVPSQMFKWSTTPPNRHHNVRLALTDAGFAAPRTEPRLRAGSGLWTAGAQLPLSPILRPERRQLRCRTPKSKVAPAVWPWCLGFGAWSFRVLAALPLHNDLATACG